MAELRLSLGSGKRRLVSGRSASVRPRLPAGNFHAGADGRGCRQSTAKNLSAGYFPNLRGWIYAVLQTAGACDSSCCGTDVLFFLNSVVFMTNEFELPAFQPACDPT